MQRVIDDSARAAGRDPKQVKRAANVVALDGDPGGWADQLIRISSELGFETLLVGVPSENPIDFIRRLGEDVAPRVRDALTVS